MKHGITRRQALQFMGIGGLSPLYQHPLAMLIGSLGESLIRGAEARAAGTANVSRNFVTLFTFNGLNRTVFDCPLTPNGSGDAFIPNTQAITNYRSDRGGIYETRPVTVGGKTYYMPWLWGADIPTTSGARIPMSRLLENMLILRGVNQGFDGHEENSKRIYRPEPSRASLTGAVADAGPSPLGAINLDGLHGVQTFKSDAGLGILTVDANRRPLPTMLSAFNKVGDKSYFDRRRALETLINGALDSLSDFANSSLPGADALYRDRTNAEKLIKKAFNNLDGTYNLLVAKYQNLITECTDVTQVLSDTIPTVGPGAKGREIVYRSSKNYLFGMHNGDLRTAVQTGHWVAENGTILKNVSSVSGLAQGMALAEFLLTFDEAPLSNSIILGTGGVSNLTFTRSYALANGGGSSAIGAATGNPFAVLDGQNVDEHDWGRYVSLVTNSFLYRAYAACLWEFTRVLSQKTLPDGRNLFDETVIHLASEFHRNGRNDGGGSDHGWNGSVLTLLSGAIKEPLILGNIRTDNPTDGNHRGTWGEGAEVDFDGTRGPLNIGHATSTVAALARCQAPMPNFKSVVQESGGRVVARLSGAQNK